MTVAIPPLLHVPARIHTGRAERANTCCTAVWAVLVVGKAKRTCFKRRPSGISCLPDKRPAGVRIVERRGRYCWSCKAGRSVPMYT